MKVVFDPDIPEDIKEEILQTLEEEQIKAPCKECGSETIYVALIDNTLDVKCYECGFSYLEIELSEEEEEE